MDGRGRCHRPWVGERNSNLVSPLPTHAPEVGSNFTQKKLKLKVTKPAFPPPLLFFPLPSKKFFLLPFTFAKEMTAWRGRGREGPAGKENIFAYSDKWMVTLARRENTCDFSHYISQTCFATETLWHESNVTLTSFVGKAQTRSLPLVSDRTKTFIEYFSS